MSQELRRQTEVRDTDLRVFDLSVVATTISTDDIIQELYMKGGQMGG